jgi:hypothetical protein
MTGGGREVTVEGDVTVVSVDYRLHRTRCSHSSAPALVIPPRRTKPTAYD